MPITQYIGVIIRGRRKECGLTLEELANLAGISRTQLSNIELGKCCASAEILFTLLVCLEIDSHDIYELKRQLMECDTRYLAEREYIRRKRR